MENVIIAQFNLAHEATEQNILKSKSKKHVQLVNQRYSNIFSLRKILRKRKDILLPFVVKLQSRSDIY